MANESRAAQIYADHMPMDVLIRGGGVYKFKVTFSEYLLNAAGGVHGGMVLSALDIAIAGGGAASVNDGLDMYGITLSVTGNFIAPAPAGTLICEGVTIGGGKSTKFVEAKLSGEDGTIYATASGSVRVIPLANDGI